MKYTVTVREVLARTVVIEGDSLNDALDKVANLYDNQDIVLDYNDFSYPPDIEGNPSTKEELALFEDVTSKYESIEDD